jgi:hypothetical protein
VSVSSVLASVNTFSAASGDIAKAAAIFLPLLPTTPRKAKMTEICGNFFTFLSVPTPPKIENCQTKQVGFSFACPPRTACGFAKQEREFISVPLAWYNTDNFSKCQKWTQKNRKPFLISCLGVPFYVAAVIQFLADYNSTNWN